MTKMLIIFTVLTIANVIMSTIKSIVTIKADKWIASFVSALYYGYYNVVLIYTVADFPLWQKVLVTFACNLIGVFVVKWAEEKARKDKLWKIEATIPKEEGWESIIGCFKDVGIPVNYVDIQKYILINCYCATQKQSAGAKAILDSWNAKYFVAESKNL